MNALEIINSLKGLGFTLEDQDNQLKVTASKNRLTSDQLKLIKENKPAILRVLSLSKNGLPELLQITHQNKNPLPSKLPAAQSLYFFEGQQPNGKILQLKKDEFDELVDFFRVLLDMDKRQQELPTSV